MTDNINDAHNFGGDTDYWAVPIGAKTLYDLIRYKGMSSEQASIFELAYCLGEVERDLTIPPNAKALNDLIEYKEMSFAQGSIFKAPYRLGDDRHHSHKVRDLNKVVYYANRMLLVELRKSERE